jgi:hypothetical protein
MTPGTRVLLRTCPHGEPGIVRGTDRGRVVVEWTDLGIARRHRPEALQSVPIGTRSDTSPPT